MARVKQIEEAVGKLVSAFGMPSGGLIMVAAKDNFDCVSPEAQEMATKAVQTAACSDAAGGESGE